MNRKTEEQLKQKIREGYNHELTRGIAKGIWAASRIIYDYANDENLTAEQRLQNIREFCEVLARENEPEDGGNS